MYDRIYVCIRFEDVPKGLVPPSDRPGQCFDCGAAVVVSDATWKTTEGISAGFRCLQCVPADQRGVAMSPAPESEILDELRSMGVSDADIERVSNIKVGEMIDRLLENSPKRKQSAWHW